MSVEPTMNFEDCPSSNVISSILLGEQEALDDEALRRWEDEGGAVLPEADSEESSQKPSRREDSEVQPAAGKVAAWEKYHRDATSPTDGERDGINEPVPAQSG